MRLNGMGRASVRRRRLSFVGLALLLLLTASCRDTGQIALSDATIVVSDQAGEDVLFAARELQGYLEKLTGRELPIVDDSHPLDGAIVSVGPSRHTADLDTTGLRPGGFLIKTTGDNLALVGADDEATQFAVYDFLERQGIRWYWPGEFGEVVPKTASLVVGPLDIVQNPDFAWRDRGPGGALWGATSGPTEMHERELLLGITAEHQAQVRLWEKRNKWGGLKIYGGHSLGEVFPPGKFAKTHPEYYALVNGKRAVPGTDYDYKHGGQVCTTNPGVVRAAVEWVRDFLTRNPEYDGVHVTVNDGGGFCECERCRALDSTSVLGRPGLEVDEMRKTAQRTVITDRIYTFVNQVAEEVQKTHPGKLVFSMAYSRYINPPEKIRLHPQVVPQYCLWSAYRHANPEFRSRHREIAAGWAGAANRKGIYEYDINGSWPGLHRLVMSHIAESIRYVHSLGFDLYQTQSGDDFAINGMNYYIAGKLLWDTDVDEKRILADFYAKAFGRSGPQVERYHRLLQDAWDRSTGQGQDITCSSLETTRLPELFTPELMQQCEQALNQAAGLAENDLIRKRVEFFRKGFRYTQLTVEGVQRARKLYAAGIDIMRPTRAESRLAKMSRAEREALIQECLSAWEEREQYVESLKNDFVLPYFWVIYNDTTREFNPLDNLRQMTGGQRPESKRLTRANPSESRGKLYISAGEGS